jgi:hypothetical protein
MAYEQKIDVIEREHTWLRHAPQRSAFRAALASAYSTFVCRHPQWAAALFDEHFLTHRAIPLLARCVTRDGQPTPGGLAAAWADQMALMEGPRRQWLIAALTPAAADFLRWLEAELRSHPEFKPLFDSRALDTIAHAAIQTAQAMEALRTEVGIARAKASADRIIFQAQAMVGH